MTPRRAELLAELYVAELSLIASVRGLSRVVGLDAPGMAELVAAADRLDIAREAVEEMRRGGES
jgi:hypothetical protein